MTMIEVDVEMERYKTGFVQYLVALSLTLDASVPGEGTTMLQRSLNLSPAVLVELRSLGRLKGKSAADHAYTMFFPRFFSMLFPQKWGCPVSFLSNHVHPRVCQGTLCPGRLMTGLEPRPQLEEGRKG